MRNLIYRITALTLAIVLLVAIAAGCRGGDGGDETEFIFVSEIAQIASLAANFPNMHNFTLTDGSLYFTTTSDMSGTSLFRTTQIIRVDLDMSDIRNLSNHSILANYTTPPPPNEAEGGSIFIFIMQPNNEDNLWVVERSSYMTFDFPSNFDLSSAEASEIWEHREMLEQSYTIRKLDNTGAEILSVDTDRLVSSPNWDGITTFQADDDGNIYIGSGRTIYVLETDGNIQFTLTTDEFIYPSSLIMLSDGRVAHRGWSGGQLSSLRIIDVDSKAWGELIELPPDVSEVFHGNDEHLAVFYDRSHLMAIDKVTGETVQLLNWVATGIDHAGIGNVLILPDGLILLTRTRSTPGTTGQGSRRTDLAVIRKVPYDEVQEKTVITIATYKPELLTNAVMEFNETNTLYRVEIVERELNWQEQMSDLNKLILEMMTGGGPDIIHTYYVPVNHWAAQDGVKLFLVFPR